MALQLKLWCHAVKCLFSTTCLLIIICSLFIMFQSAIATLCPASAFPLTTLSLCAETFAGKGETMSLSGMTLLQYSNGKYTSIWLFVGRHVHGPFLSVQLKPLLWLATLSPAIPVSPHCQLLTCSVRAEKGLDLSHNNSESLYLHLPKHALSNKSL